MGISSCPWTQIRGSRYPTIVCRGVTTKRRCAGAIGKIEHFSVDIKAYWRKYDPGSLTTANDDEIRPWSKVGHVLSLGTSLTYPPSGETEVKGYDLAVPLTSSYLDALGPRLLSIKWRPVGNNWIEEFGEEWVKKYRNHNCYLA